ncbi:MAG: hypothetical protein KHZ87_07500 [Clostridiales bacterium]|nr:hypothetical protein [Clostridiales bacterium]MDU0940103.1 SHOCT domain-containing protein [Clostridiales bacterium]MDU1042774.1 SHOCT domain-containing protein [Clostridiales bacterium]MDU3490136.1 SHOCT domain-containing protein [Clostridiales bacterium]
MTDNKSITSVSDTVSFITKPEPLKNEQLQADVDYYLAQKILEKMREKSLISDEEFIRITKLNRKKFSPYLAEIMP